MCCLSWLFISNTLLFIVIPQIYPCRQCSDERHRPARHTCLRSGHAYTRLVVVSQNCMICRWSNLVGGDVLFSFEDYFNYIIVFHRNTREEPEGLALEWANPMAWNLKNWLITIGQSKIPVRPHTECFTEVLWTITLLRTFISFSRCVYRSIWCIYA